MVQMKATLIEVSSNTSKRHLIFSLSNKNCINCTPIQFVNEGKGSHPTIRRMNPCIAYDSSSPVLENTARPSDFLTSTKHSHTQSRCICHVEKLGTQIKKRSKAGLQCCRQESKCQVASVTKVTDVTHLNRS